MSLALHAVFVCPEVPIPKLCGPYKLSAIHAVVDFSKFISNMADVIFKVNFLLCSLICLLLVTNITSTRSLLSLYLM